MSYCVECGVKLAASEQVCPLCNTKVYNPNDPGNADGERPYPQSVEAQIRGLNRKELAWLVFLFLLVPAGATVMIDLLTGEPRLSLSWSFIVAASAGMICVWLIPPVLFSRMNIYLSIMLDSLAVAGLLSTIAWQVGNWQWCIYLGIPLALLTGLCSGLSAAIIRAKRLRRMTRASLVCLVLAIFIIGIEMCIKLVSTGAIQVNWSLYAVAPLVFLALLLFYISRKSGLADELKRRLFV